MATLKQSRSTAAKLKGYTPAKAPWGAPQPETRTGPAGPSAPTVTPLERSPFMLSSLPVQASGSANITAQWLGGTEVPRNRLFPVNG